VDLQEFSRNGENSTHFSANCRPEKKFRAQGIPVEVDDFFGIRDIFG
jgi:hypothetical protein